MCPNITYVAYIWGITTSVVWFSCVYTRQVGWIPLHHKTLRCSRLENYAIVKAIRVYKPVDKETYTNKYVSTITRPRGGNIPIIGLSTALLSHLRYLAWRNSTWNEDVGSLTIISDIYISWRARLVWAALHLVRVRDYAHSLTRWWARHPWCWRRGFIQSVSRWGGRGYGGWRAERQGIWRTRWSESDGEVARLRLMDVVAKEDGAVLFWTTDQL